MSGSIKQDISKEDNQREARGQKVLDSARNAHFERTGEPSEAPDHDDAVRERVTSGSSGSKSGNKKPVLAAQQEVASKKGTHNGRPHPPKQKAGGEDFDAGAANGGEVNAQNAKRS
jgi:hypothetical protein